jgi:malonyl-CoA O-methyltransferase
MFHPPLPDIVLRASESLRRRVAYYWSGGLPPRPDSSVEAALKWLAQPQPGPWLPRLAGQPMGDPQATALAVAVAWTLGAEELVDRWKAWLLSIQRPDGALSDPAHFGPSLSATAAFVQSLQPWEATSPQVHQAVQAASEYLSVSLQEKSFEEPPWDCLVVLHDAAQRFGKPQWRDQVCRQLRGDEQSILNEHCDVSIDRLARRCAGLLDLGLEEPACKLLDRLAQRQRRDGSLPALPVCHWVSSAGLAHVALLWQRVGRREAADRALDCLRRRQTATGGFPANWGRGSGTPRERQPARTVIYYLETVRLQVESAFGPEATTVPKSIDPADGRVAAVRGWLGQLPTEAQVADLGCGKGRYVRLLAAEFPGLHWTGVDTSAAMLAELPAAVTACRGSLLRIPLAKQSFDGALAVESLEHALVPERAVAELCRIVCPGGRVLVIDKDRSKQPLSRHEPWERWFTAAELADWLGRWCDDVCVAPVAHCEGRPAKDLFLAASGRVR